MKMGDFNLENIEKLSYHKQRSGVNLVKVHPKDNLTYQLILAHLLKKLQKIIIYM